MATSINLACNFKEKRKVQTCQFSYVSGWLVIYRLLWKIWTLLVSCWNEIFGICVKFLINTHVQHWLALSSHPWETHSHSQRTICATLARTFHSHTARCETGNTSTVHSSRGVQSLIQHYTCDTYVPVTHSSHEVSSHFSAIYACFNIVSCFSLLDCGIIYLIQ